MGVLSKEYPWLFAPRRFLFGLVEVPQYGYRWGLSKAYIELMCMDTTIIKYADSEKDKVQDREDKAAEAKRLFLERKAQKEKQQNTQTIKLKD